MPTGWRPVDVALEYPINVVDNPKKQIKYSTNNSILTIRWAWIQLIVTFFLMFHLFVVMSSFENFMILLYASVILLNIFIFTSILDGKRYMIVGEYVKFGMIIYGLFVQNFTWYGIEGIYILLFISYFLISIFCTYFLLNRK